MGIFNFRWPELFGHSLLRKKGGLFLTFLKRRLKGWMEALEKRGGVG